VFSGLISFVSLFSMCMITMISRRNIRNEDNNYRRMADDSINSVDSWIIYVKIYKKFLNFIELY
jgi:hypothetical protein